MQMFDRLAWRREFYERYLLGQDDEEEYDDYDTPFGDLARRADDIEAGRLELPPRWKLDRPSPGLLVWTTPSGRRYACGPAGEPLPLPDGEAPFHSWAS
jgi:hypothetical protein